MELESLFGLILIEILSASNDLTAAGSSWKIQLPRSVVAGMLTCTGADGFCVGRLYDILYAADVYSVLGHLKNAPAFLSCLLSAV